MQRAKHQPTLLLDSQGASAPFRERQVARVSALGVLVPERPVPDIDLLGYCLAVAPVAEWVLQSLATAVVLAAQVGQLLGP